MIVAAASLLILAWLPGAVLFRLPVMDRDRRAALTIEERVFWQIVLSLCVTLTTALALAALGQYSLNRLLAADVAASAALAAAARLRLRLSSAARPTLSVLIPIAIAALGIWRFSPPAEYVMAGKDPGTYMNEGILTAQRGTLVYEDPLVAQIPGATRSLFFAAEREEAAHFGTRFMGFPILDLESGRVRGQFPHLFPMSIAIGYGVDGLTGARRTVIAWAVLGLVAVYLAGARLLGRTAAAGAVTLLALNVVEVWFGRYPNAEVVMQALLFAALLANARAHVDGDRYFAPIAAVLLILLLFLRIDAVLAVGAVLAANLLAALRGGRLHWSFFAVLAPGAVLSAFYYLGPMRSYALYPIYFILNLRWWHQLLAAAGIGILLAILWVGRSRPHIGRRLTDALPMSFAIALIVLAMYALFFRTPAGKLALENAYALRMYANFYVTVPAVLAALAGFALVARRAFWHDPALLLTASTFAVFFFFKIRIVPEHFWAARRFLPVILPATLLLASAAATWGWRQAGWRRAASGLIGTLFLALLAGHYARAAAPVLDHVEYAGMIPQLEQLAARIADDELLIVESRDAGSDAHVFALPLAYIYARPVLVFASAVPDREKFAVFLEWARTQYRRVYFLGGGGTDLLSRHWRAVSIASQRFQVPEYESAWNAYPRTIRRKEFDFGLYELLPGSGDASPAFDLDVGTHDDLHVVRFHAKEEASGRTMRWSQRQSFISLPSLRPTHRQIVLVMSSGGRPQAAPPADVTVQLNDHPLGTVRVTDGFKPYVFDLPAGVAAEAAEAEAPSRLRLVTTAWNPHLVIGSGDDRELGVMVDRVQVR